MSQDAYRHRRHNKTLLYVHLIFVTKFREKLRDKWVWDRIKHEVLAACRKKGIVVERMESDIDHLHMPLQYPPTLSVSAIVHTLKQVTMFTMWKHYPQYMKKHFWSDHFLWSEGYFACSVGNASKETVDAYIKNQG